MLDSGLVIQRSQQYPIQSRDGSRTILDSPPPKTKWVLTPESFNQMLLWLNHDRNLAGEKYEEIRSRLIKRFQQLRCREPEDLANKTFDRVARKLPEIIGEYKGAREPYFFSIAHYVYKEYLRTPVFMSLASTDFLDSDSSTPEEMLEKELLDSCLRQCMEKLHRTNREMIRDYYCGERQVKIQSRQRLAECMGIKLSNLRLRAQRVRTALKECIVECMESKTKEPKV
jgi:DNA-directed RNA polymerase specialized sigma24 family protein